jgi:AraC-like DNA-binding protein
MAPRIHRVIHHRSGIQGVEAMTLFSNHAFPRHSHDHFGIGIMTAGTTPHAYVIQRRARLARRHLAAGLPPSDAALLAGFADQSHMTRAFVRHFGITPARYQAALA